MQYAALISFVSTASDIPTFVIDPDEFQNGANRLVIEITHTDYGTATVPMDFNLNIPTTTAPTTPPPPRTFSPVNTLIKS